MFTFSFDCFLFFFGKENKSESPNMQGDVLLQQCILIFVFCFYFCDGTPLGVFWNFLCFAYAKRLTLAIV